MKAVLIGIDLDDPYNQRKLMILQFEGGYCVAEANDAKRRYDNGDDYPFHHFAVIADKYAWDAWREQQPHLDEKYLRSLK